MSLAEAPVSGADQASGIALSARAADGHLKQSGVHHIVSFNAVDT